METKASYTLVGLFALLAIFATTAFLVWNTTRGNRNGTTLYAVNFKGSVSGLSVANDVRFNGIKVGRVQQIKIDRDDPTSVHVIVEIAADTPLRENSEARLELAGLTGLATVAISGGTADSPMLKAQNAHSLPVIKSSMSPRLDTLLSEAPDLLDAARSILHRVEGMLSEENSANLHKTLAALASMAEGLETHRSSLDEAFRNINTASRTLVKVMDAAETLIGKDLPTASASLRNAGKDISNLVKEVEPGLKRFSGSGLEEFSRLTSELRLVLRTLDRIAQRLDSDPRRFFFGDKIPEYRAK